MPDGHQAARLFRARSPEAGGRDTPPLISAGTAESLSNVRRRESLIRDAGLIEQTAPALQGQNGDRAMLALWSTRYRHGRRIAPAERRIDEHECFAEATILPPADLAGRCEGTWTRPDPTSPLKDVIRPGRRAAGAWPPSATAAHRRRSQKQTLHPRRHPLELHLGASMPTGSTNSLPLRSSKCSSGFFTSPLLPDLPMICPRLTCAPLSTAISCRCA